MTENTPGAFAERLTAPWWSWLVVPAVAGAVAAEVATTMAVTGTAVATLVALLALGFGWLAWLSRVRLVITPAGADSVLQIDDARLPIRHLTSAEPLSPDQVRAALGPSLHPYAFVVHRPWINRGLLIRLDDPDDPTPYVIVSTRHPDQLATALGLPNLGLPNLGLPNPDLSDPSQPASTSEPELAEREEA